MDNAQQAASADRAAPRMLQGVVCSNRMDKTVVVEVTQRVLHKGYKKYVRRRERHMAHDAENQYLPGDVVKIVSSRPESRHKRWRVVELVERPD